MIELTAVYIGIAQAGDSLVVLDATRRVYAGRSRDGASYHLIQPARPDDARIGDGLRREGDLVCTCAGATYRGTCWRTREAESLEGGQASGMMRTAWVDSPAGAGDAVEAYRG